MATEQIRLQFIADMDQLKSQMLAGGASVEETEKRIQKLAKAYKVAEKAADKLAREQEDSAKKTQSALKAIEGLGRVMGGPLGAATGALGDLSDTAEGATGAIGAMGTAAIGTVGGVTAALGAVAAYAGAMVALGDAATEAIARMDEMGRGSLITQEQRDAVAEYNVEMNKLSLQMDRLTLVMAEAFLPAFNDIAGAVSQSIDDWAWLADHFGITAERFATLTRLWTDAHPVLAVLSGDVTNLREALADLWGGQEQVAEATTKTGKSFFELAKAATSTTEITAGLDEHLKSLEGSQRKAGDASKEHEQALAKQAAATAALEGILQSASESTMTSEEKMIAKYDEKIAKIAELEAVSQDHALADTARAAVLAEMTAARQEEEDKVNAKRAEEAAKLAADKAAADQQAHDQWVAFSEIQKAVTKELKDAQTEYILNQLSLADQVYSGVADLAVWAIDKQIESMGHLSDSEKKEAKRLWALRQGAAISSIVMSGAVAYMNALATFAPSGWLAPILAAAVVGPPTALQIAQVASESPPSFAIGGVVEADHRMIQASPGEGVVTRRGMSALGPDGLAALNRGRQGGGSGDELVMRYRHRDLSIVLRDHLRLDTPLARALDGATVPGRRTR
jgi:hypothetical protein